MHMHTGSAVDTLPPEGRDQGWGCHVIKALHTQSFAQHPHPNPPLKGEGTARGETIQ
jgi:hypothetical protein